MDHRLIDMTNEIDPEKYGEFRGSTKEAIQNLLSKLVELETQIEDLQEDVKILLAWRNWLVGVGAGAGFISGLIGEWIFKHLFNNLKI